MLSYRHAFHAGNHADVLKHIVLVESLSYLISKPKALWYIDTHAGAGTYRLDSGFASRNREFDAGIGRLWKTTRPPEPVERYLSLIRMLNPDGVLTCYPGSPWIAAHLLREQDRLWLHELHPADREQLMVTCSDPRIRIRGEDGFNGLRSLLPPEPRRALVLIDPPYEVKSDYDAVLATLRDATRRFPSGTYVLWYPLLASGQSERLIERLDRIGAPRWLHASLAVRSSREPGMYGSGLFVINPHYLLPESLRSLLPFLQQVLAQDADAAHSLAWDIP